ncbi:MAG: phage major capsid protein [Clostridium sp.]
MTLLKDQLEGFVPVEQTKDIMKGIARGSSVLRLSKVEPMESDTKRFPVLADGPGAYWVGESERIKTTEAKWIFPEMTAKKIAVIIPVTKEKLKDTTVNVFEELKPAIAEAFYQAIDAACLFGTNSPFAKNIFKSAVDANNFIVDGTSTLDLDVSDVMGLVEDAGLDVNGFTAHNGVKNRLRKLRDSNGNQLYVNGVDQKEFYNEPIEFSRNGAWDKTKAEVIAADWSKSLVGIRDGLEYEILKEATLQGTLGADGKPLSLAEQGLIAIMATMRLGFLPIKDEAFAVLATEGTTPGGESSRSVKISANTKENKNKGNKDKNKGSKEKNAENKDGNDDPCDDVDNKE